VEIEIPSIIEDAGALKVNACPDIYILLYALSLT
jgi:hypothetical protein